LRHLGGGVLLSPGPLGFTRENFATCHQPCRPETGRCECSHSTAGPTCEQCLKGYYGNARIGTPGDCQPCLCTGRSGCAAITQTGEVVCTDCLVGRMGVRCQKCEGGYHGDPLGQGLGERLCVRCDCSSNADANAVGTCHLLTGRCLNSSPAGTSGPVTPCHPDTGHCLPHVSRRDCSSCQVGFFDLRPGLWSCNCDPMGSVSIECRGNGTCLCRHGFTAYKCDKCQLNFYHNRATHHCQECPTCYGLVRDTAEKLGAQLADLEKLLAGYDCHADLVEAVAREALATSNRTHVLLMELRDDSTVEHTRGQAAAQEEPHGCSGPWPISWLWGRSLWAWASTLGNITSSVGQMALTDGPGSTETNQTLHMQTKEKLVEKIRAEMEPLIKTATRNLEMDVLEDVEEESKDSVVQAKLSRTASRHLVGHLDPALQQLAQQENHTASLSAQLTSESPTPGGKVQRLRQAAQVQRGHLALIETDLQEAGQERDSLRDITLTLPSFCSPPQGAGAG
ncbi:hypothetical protein NHX12_027940, partial [Muraenolepis orangiensis]